MNTKICIVICALFLAGCANSPNGGSQPAVVTGPPMRTGGPNWEEIDKSVQRIKERESGKPRLVETDRKVEQGFFPMSDADYAAALASARDEVRKANPKMSESAVETEAIKRADDAKRSYEHSHSSTATSTYEWKKP
jgi:hypothetical protein